MSIKGFSVSGVTEQYDYNYLDNKPEIHSIPTGGTAGQVLAKTSGADYAVGWVDQTGGGGGGDITVDDALSTTSENPVQNRVVTTAINAKYAKPAYGIPSTDMTSAVQASLAKADTALQSAPVTSVNGQTGDVTIQAATDAQVTTAVNTWLGNNVAQETGYVLDSTLTMSNAAAPADKVGELKSALEQAIDDFAVPTQEAVDNWLTAHPEATTTVQDGSITKVKLAPELADKLPIEADKTIAVADVSTLRNTLNYLSELNVSDNATITIELDGVYNFAESLCVSMAASGALVLKGSDPVQYSMTGLSSITGSEGEYSVTVTLTDTSGIAIGDYVAIENINAVETNGVLEGVWEVLSKTDSTITVLNTCRTAIALSDFSVSSADVYKFTTVFDFSSLESGDGINILHNTTVQLKNICVIGGGGANYGVMVGMAQDTNEVEGGSTAQLIRCAVNGFVRSGFWCGYGSSIYARNSIACNCGDHGFEADVGGSLTLGWGGLPTIANGNTGSGIAAVGGGAIWSSLIVACGNGYGIHASNGGTVVSNTVYANRNNIGLSADTMGSMNIPTAYNANNTTYNTQEWRGVVRATLATNEKYDHRSFENLAHSAQGVDYSGNLNDITWGSVLRVAANAQNNPAAAVGLLVTTTDQLGNEVYQEFYARNTSWSKKYYRVATSGYFSPWALNITRRTNTDAYGNGTFTGAVELNGTVASYHLTCTASKNVAADAALFTVGYIALSDMPIIGFVDGVMKTWLLKGNHIYNGNEQIASGSVFSCSGIYVTNVT